MGSMAVYNGETGRGMTRSERPLRTQRCQLTWQNLYQVTRRGGLGTNATGGPKLPSKRQTVHMILLVTLLSVLFCKISLLKIVSLSWMTTGCMRRNVDKCKENGRTVVLVSPVTLVCT